MLESIVKNEFMYIQETPKKHTDRAIVLEQALSRAQLKEHRDDSFNHLLSRLDRLRQISQQRRNNKSYVKKIQTSFVF